MFKWMAAAFIVFGCFLPVIFVVWLIVMAIFAALFSRENIEFASSVTVI
jgi:hypothetical protein